MIVNIFYLSSDKDTWFISWNAEPYRQRDGFTSVASEIHEQYAKTESQLKTWMSAPPSEQPWSSVVAGLRVWEPAANNTINNG